MTKFDQEKFERDLGIEILEKVPLAGYTTWKIGGPADYFCSVSDREKIVALVEGAESAGIEVVVIGRGSNLLVADRGFRGLVVRVFGGELKLLGGERICVDAGVSLMDLVKLTVKEGLSGLEFAAGIPGSVGGSIYGNAGAHRREIKDVLFKIDVLDRDSGVYRRGMKSAADLRFDYRDSDFKRNRSIILGADFQLARGDRKEISSQVKEYMGRRQRRHPLDWPSSGSVFRNPPGQIAADLIERAGLKGRRVGGVEVSEKHANFMINVGGARAKDVLELYKIVQDSVEDKFGVKLELENIMVGFDR